MATVLDDTALDHVRVIAADMDCTLLADDGTMPPGMFDRIRALDAAGITFCAASGRPSYTLRAMFDEVADHMAFISDNGAAISCRGELVYKDLIEVTAYQELLAFTHADGRGIPTVCGLDACFISRSAECFDSYFRTFYKHIVYLDSLEALDADVNKYTVYFPELNAEEVYAEAYRDRWGERFSVTNAGKMWIDIMNPWVDKGRGLERLCAHLGASTADAMALGDTYNDIPMLKVAGHSYVVANAEEHMREHARFVAPSNNERGVAQVIDAVLAAQRG